MFLITISQQYKYFTALLAVVHGVLDVGHIQILYTMDISQSCTFDSYPNYRMSLGPDSRDSRRLNWLGPRDLSSTHLGQDTRGRDPGEPSTQSHIWNEYTMNSPFHATTYIIQTTGLCSHSCNPRVTQPHETR